MRPGHWCGILIAAAACTNALLPGRNLLARDTTTMMGQDVTVTFTTDVAPIIFGACATCHRPGGAAPFSLLTYDDVRSRAEQIASVTRQRLMPPWKPEPGFGRFAGERRLTDEQIALFRRWIDQGRVEGDRALLPPRPTWSTEWELGEPDLVLETALYTLRADGEDVYRNFVLPVPIAEIRHVRAWQFLPGNSHVVHHATMQLDPAGASRRLDAQDPEPGYEGVIPHSVQSPDGYFLGWTPGQMTYVAPDGMAWPLRPGTDLVMMLHLRPHGRAEQVQARIGLYFSDTPPTRVPTVIRMTRQDLDIPAGETRYRATDEFRLDVDVDAYTIQPHAHYLAREVSASAILPDGRREPLLYIRDWDFDWQGVYHYERPVFLPAGTTIVMEYIYDNSAANPRNPHRPPRRVTYGQQTTDEMAELWIQVVARSAADRVRLTRSVEARIVREEIIGREHMLARDPTNTALRNDVALLYVTIGDLERAAGHFAGTLQLEPDSPAAHYNFGNTLLGLGRWESAADSFERALALRPDYALAHAGLGLARQGQARLEDAVRHFVNSLQFDPRDADTHHYLATALRALGRPQEAVTHYREALRIDPGHAPARAGLAAVEP
jgi:tetratricopeptide (TPR) repeat protein